jgi:hypothetical protein
MPKESVHVSWFMKKLRVLPNTWWTRIEQKSIRGTPDIIGCVRCECGAAKLVAIEAKREGGKATALQLEVLDQLDKVGAFARLAFLPRDAVTVLEHLRRLQEPGPFANGARELFLKDQE